jgi:hypothetical protein
LLFKCALEQAIRRIQVNQDGLELNGPHHILIYADDVNIFGESVHAVDKNPETLVVARKETV